MIALATKLLTVLAALVGLYSKAKREEEQRDAQQENDSAQDNPADWFAGHFNGVQQPSAVSGDARPAAQANAKKSETQ
jgi:hypothetical protein